MAEGNAQPIIVKKVIVSAGGHHGGAWKVAYADFVTAMMAFFLLLWLLNVTTDEQRNGIADYFAPTVASRSPSGSGGVMGGLTLSKEGARTSDRSQAAVVIQISPPEAKSKKEGDDGEDTGKEGETDKKLKEAELLRQMAEREQREFERAEEELREAIEEVPDLAGLSQNLIIDNTPEGMRIQLIDKDGNSMFPSGRANPLEHTRLLMQKVAEVVSRLPNKLAITGHTDSLPFRNANGYGNWELSADRANSSRRTLMEFGIQTDRISSVAGKADREPLIEEDPSHPSNRRISIVLLRESYAVAPPPEPIVPPAPGLRTSRDG
jgi:chemotaxis protein MotB